MASAWTRTLLLPLLLLLLLSFLALGSDMHKSPVTHLDTRAVQFKIHVGSKLITGHRPVRKSLNVTKLFLVNHPGGCNATAFSPEYCKAYGSFIKEANLLVKSIGEHMYKQYLSHPASWRHVTSWGDAVKAEADEEKGEGETASVLAEIPTAKVYLRELYFQQGRTEQWSPAKLNTNVTVENMSVAAKKLLANYMHSVLNLEEAVTEVGSKSSSSVAVALTDIADKIFRLYANLMRLDTTLKSCQKKAPPGYMMFPDGLDDVEPVTDALGHLGATASCSMRNSSVVEYEYSMPVMHKESAWAVFSAGHVEFLLSGRRCRVLASHPEIPFATNGTHLRDWPRRLEDGIYELPRHAQLSDTGRCLQALVHFTGMDDAVRACAVTCRSARNSAPPSALSLNTTSYAVLNPTADVAVLCRGAAPTLLPRIVDGRHEVTLPCHCGVDGLLLPGEGCENATGTQHLVVDSSWTDGGFAPAALFASKERESETTSLDLRVVEEEEDVGGGAAVATVLLALCFVAAALYALHLRYNVFTKAGCFLGRLWWAVCGSPRRHSADVVRFENAMYNNTVEMRGSENPGYKE